jgi:hypothetical protein
VTQSIKSGFINKWIENIVPTVTVRLYLNQKQWITGNILTEQKGRADAFRERDLEGYKKSCPPTNHQTGKASIQD